MPYRAIASQAPEKHLPCPEEALSYQSKNEMYLMPYAGKACFCRHQHSDDDGGPFYSEA
jgi:hypothetical protein